MKNGFLCAVVGIRFSLFVCVMLYSIAHAVEADLRTPAPGSKERKELMDALRQPCETDLKQKVVFKVEHLKISGDWAFARVTPLRPDHTSIDYKQTKYREAFEGGTFDAMGEALLQRKNNQWKVIEWRFGATDTEVELWIAKYRLPQSLFR